MGAVSTDIDEAEPGPTTSSGESTRRPGRRRSSATTAQRIGVAAVAVVAVVLAIVCCDAAPTGSAVIDAAYRAAFVVATVLAGARARRWSLLTAAGIVSVGVDGWMIVPAVAAIGLGILLAWRNRRDRVVGAVAGALVAVCALRLSWPASPTGATAVLAALSVVPLWISGYRVARRGTRRQIRWIVAGLAAVALLGVLAGAALALTQRGRLVDAAEASLDAANAVTGGTTDGDASFDTSQEQFETVASTSASWWAAPARLVPVVAQNVRAVGVAAQAGADLSGVAAELSEQVDYDALQREDGSIDVGRLAGFRPAAEQAEAAVERARADVDALGSPWLVPPISDQLSELQGHLDDAGASTALGAEATRRLPAILGAEGTRRYLLLLGNPAEARDVGGHLGNWAELTVTDGDIEVVEVGTPYELFGPGTQPRPTLDDPDRYPPSLVEIDPTLFPQNWGATADLSTVAALAAELYPQVAGGQPIDGVLYADPLAFAALLQLTGPVRAGELQLDADTAVDFLTRGQFEGAQNQDQAVSDVIELALERLTTSRLPSGRELGSTFGEVVRRGHLQFALTGEDGGELLSIAGLDQQLGAPDGGDVVAVLNRNANPSKIDAYLRRSIDYDVRWDPANGQVRSRVIVTLHNDAPSSGLDPEVLGSAPGAAPGTNRTQLSVLSPFDAVGALVDGAPAPIGSRRDLPGLRRHTVTVDVPPGGRRDVVIDLAGEVDAGPLYRLRWYNQPLLQPDESRLIIRPVDATLPGGGSEGRVEIDDDRVVDVIVGAQE